MIHPWMKLNRALIRYRPSTNSRIVPILAKSMLPVPRIFSISPSDSTVVAFPRIFGPATLNTVEHAAQIITIKIAILYFPMYWASCLIDFFRSFGFSPGCMPRPIRPIGPLLRGCWFISLLMVSHLTFLQSKLFL